MAKHLAPLTLPKQADVVCGGCGSESDQKLALLGVGLIAVYRFLLDAGVRKE
jgi:hypothetical protein